MRLLPVQSGLVWLIYRVSFVAQHLLITGQISVSELIMNIDILSIEDQCWVIKLIEDFMDNKVFPTLFGDDNLRVGLQLFRNFPD